MGLFFAGFSDSLVTNSFPALYKIALNRKKVKKKSVKKRICPFKVEYEYTHNRLNAAFTLVKWQIFFLSAKMRAIMTWPRKLVAARIQEAILVQSMTGFGRGIAQTEAYGITVEMKAVNHRFLEINARLPKQLSSKEDALKKKVQARLNRGKIDIYITLEHISAKKIAVKVDKELAIAYYKSLIELAADCHLEGAVSLQQIASLSGVLSLEATADDEEMLAALLFSALDQALDAFCEMRNQEGQALQEDLLSRLSFIEEAVKQIAAQAPTVVKEQKQRLEQRIADLLGAVELDEAKLANEIAFFADKVDVSEELTRLSSHLAQFRETLNSAEAIGRKLEFILQEMLREINTIGSKSNALDINKLVIEVKSELEKIREQIQNVE